MGAYGCCAGGSRTCMQRRAAGRRNATRRRRGTSGQELPGEHPCALWLLQSLIEPDPKWCAHGTHPRAGRRAAAGTLAARAGCGRGAAPTLWNPSTISIVPLMVPFGSIFSLVNAMALWQSCRGACTHRRRAGGLGAEAAGGSGGGGSSAAVAGGHQSRLTASNCLKMTECLCRERPQSRFGRSGIRARRRRTSLDVSTAI